VPALHPELVDVPPLFPGVVVVTVVVVVIVNVLGFVVELVVEVADVPEVPLVDPGPQLAPKVLEPLPLDPEVQTSSDVPLDAEALQDASPDVSVLPPPLPPPVTPLLWDAASDVPGPGAPNDDGAPVLDTPPS